MGVKFPEEYIAHVKTLRNERINCCLEGPGLYLNLWFSMVCMQSLNYFKTVNNVSPFLLNGIDIVLYIHSNPSPSMNRMWAHRKKSNYFVT